jgi:hypothetical protein
MNKSDNEVAKTTAFDSHELAEKLRTLRARFSEFRGRL